jgi:hypothetical protein
MLIFNISNRDRLISVPRIWEWQKLKPRKSILLSTDVYDWEFYRSFLSIEDALKELNGIGIRFTEQQTTVDALREIKELVNKLDKSLKCPIMQGDF